MDNVILKPAKHMFMNMLRKAFAAIFIGRIYHYLRHLARKTSKIKKKTTTHFSLTFFILNKTKVMYLVIKIFGMWLILLNQNYSGGSFSFCLFCDASVLFIFFNNKGI